MKATTPPSQPIHVRPALREDAPDLAQFVSDYCQLDPPHRARDIAAQYLDSWIHPSRTGDFNELVKHFTKQVRFYL